MMRSTRGVVLALCLGVTAAVPATADVTVTAKYRFANGDTAIRTSYYSRKRARATAPNGMEFIYDTRAGRVTVIDPAKRRYYSAPIAEAESLATKILLARRAELRPKIEANREKWAGIVSAFSDSTHVEKDEMTTRTIAGYPCTRWKLRAGSYMTHERWTARGLSVPNFAPDMEQIVMASVLDPLGRQLMKLLLQMRSEPGLVLESSTEFHTLTQSGRFSYRALNVGSAAIPDSVWSVPKGYTRVRP
jgi:hypothetical protein